MELNEITGRIFKAAIKVHSCLGPNSGLHVARQVGLPLVYEGVRLEVGYRLDLLVEHAVVVEVKAQEGFTPVHHAQILSHLRLSGKQVGLLINFHVVALSANSQLALANSAVKRLETDP